MSQANASAIKRRAFNGSNPPSQQAVQTPQPAVQSNGPNIQTPGLTLPQVIAVIDKRLLQLESFANDSKSVTNEPALSNDVLDEFNHRFNLLTEEICNIKDIVLQLQSYTMSVNKTLMEERIQVFSDLGNDNNHLTVFDNETGNQSAVEAVTMDLKSLVESELNQTK